MNVTISRRILAFTGAAIVLWNGPATQIVVLPLVFGMYAMPTVGLRAAIALLASALLRHHLQALHWDDHLLPGLTIVVSLALPIIVSVLALADWLGWRGILGICSYYLLISAIVLAGSHHWSIVESLWSPFGRFVFAILPVLGATQSSRALPRQYPRSVFLAVILVAALPPLLLPPQKISRVYFDEAHGSWETVKAPYGPDTFGRGVNYTYSLLFKHAQSLVGSATTLDSEASSMEGGQVLVVKMPTQVIAGQFVSKLKQWVSDGGRLILIADHTNLYDTTRNLSPLATEFGFKIGSDAVFNAQGLLNTVAAPVSSLLIANIDAGDLTTWQTGTSLKGIPQNSIELSTFGLGFAEQADYSRPNRFGYFIPRPDLPFQVRTSIAASSYGKGIVAVVLDSTPWSNFSIFKQPFLKLFNSLVAVMEQPILVRMSGLGGWALLASLVLSIVIPRFVVFLLASIVFGAVLGATAHLGWVGAQPIVEDRDYSVVAAGGSNAKVEFLEQLVGPSARNYSRILSSIQKYGTWVTVVPSGHAIPQKDPQSLLLIEPNPAQLPSPDEILARLRAEKDTAILFAPEAIGDPATLAWIDGLQLISSRSVGLGIVEDIRKGGLMSRRGAALMRDVRTVLTPTPFSLLKEQQSDTLAQSFTVRPTQFPKRSGTLTVSFAADQFSDDAVGEVWEGTWPSSLGKLREAQMAAILNIAPYPRPIPTDTSLGEVIQTSDLNQYVMLEDGKRVLSGTLNPTSNPTEVSPSLSDDPEDYLATLRSRAISVVKRDCTIPQMPCQSRLIGPDMVEWIVTWSADQSGSIETIELLHERRFSGLGSTWNVVFGKR